MTLHSLTLSLILLTPFALAQEGKGKDKDAKGAGADAGMQMPKPGPEHMHLKTAEGTWDATVEMAGSPTSKGVSEQKVTMNGFWLVDEFKCDFGGMAFEGRGTTGFDPIKGKYVSTWVDNMSPWMMVTEGTFDAKTKTLNMTGSSYDEKGAKISVRTATIHKDANTVVFEMHNTGADGAEVKVLAITYVRRKAAEKAGAEKAGAEKAGAEKAK